MISILAVTAAADSTNSAWSLRVWASDDGLPNNNVTSLAQTPDGYLWVATPGKLARFDGMQFEVFSPRSIVPQFDRKITTVLQARDGGLWLGMERGPVLCLKGGKVQIITNGVPNMVAETMVEDAEGGIWALFFSGSGEMLCRIQDGKVSPMRTRGTLRALAGDNQGRIWLINDGRISVFQQGQFKVVAQVPNQTACLAAASDGGVWIGSGLVLFKYNETNGLKTIGTCNPQTDNAQPTALLEDHTGAVWLGTSDSGLFRFVAGHAEDVPASHREILSLLEDREGNLWVGTGGGGLDRIQPRAIELEGTEKGLPFEAVQSLCEDTRGAIWAATQNGLLACRRNGVWNTLTTNSGWPGGKVGCVAAARDGTVWFGTQNRELISWQDGHFKIWSNRDGIICRQIHSLLVARNGDVWIGGNVPDGLQRLHAGRLQSFHLPPDVRVIRAMAEDAAGDIWVGTANGTLLKISGDEITDESIQLSGTQWSIRSLYVSPDGSLWIGYSGWGLGRYKDGHFSHVTSQQGLFDDQISQVISDGRGWLWLGADHGIFKIRQQEFDDMAAGRTAHLHSIPYGPSDSLPSLQANFGSAPGALRSQDGRLWIPMRTALAVVRPDQLREDLEPPSVLLTRVVADDQIMAVYGGASPIQDAADLRDRQITFRFPPDYHRLEFDFTALSHTAPESVSFQYRLDGLDDKWIEGGSRRNASFSRLPAGNYRFRVRACNRDGVWNETGAALAFTVEPFLWQTWWFRLTVLIGFTSTVFAIARYVSFRRFRSKLQMVERQAVLDKERTRIARDIHDDLGCRLTKIVLLTELTLQNSGNTDNAIERAKQISATAREGMQSLDATVWAINPRNDTLPYLIDYIGQFAVDFLQATEIRCHLDLPDHPPARAISAEVRHNLFLAVKEALNNIVRHSGAHEVHLRVKTDEDELSIAIEDDGRGFGQLQGNACADGLRNMRQRLEEIHGQSRIESTPGKGSKISFIRAWRNGH
jgi:ligand-binding sensor domain-containing protein/signal transduction histidine kinase